MHTGIILKIWTIKVRSLLPFPVYDWIACAKLGLPVLIPWVLNAERTRQWLRSAELSMPVATQVVRKSGPNSSAAQRHQHFHVQPVIKKRTGWSAMFDCFKPQTIEFQQTGPKTG